MIDKPPAIKEDNFLKCPKCGETLRHFSGYGEWPECEYCLICNDVAYDKDGNVIKVFS